MRTFITALALLPMVACTSGWRDGGALSARTIDGGLHCGRSEPSASARWLDNSAEFEAAYKQLNRVTITSMGTLPEVNFGRDGVLLVEMGERPTAGYGISLPTDQTPATRTGDTARISIDWSEPSPDAVTAQVITSPCLFIAMERGGYERVEVRDELGGLRAVADVGARR